MFGVLTRTWLSAVVLFGFVVSPARARMSAEDCAIPPEVARFEFPLTRVADHLASSQQIVIVALGSSSTAGVGASSPDNSYPSRLAAELSQVFPFHRALVRNRGVGGERAADMLARFDASVAAEHPDLVLWQLGSNAVLQGSEPSNSVIHDGIRRTRSIGADLILIDPQYAPKLIAKPHIERTVDLISAIAGDEKIDLLHRFALMRHWHEQAIPFDAFLSPDGLHMNDWSYACLAKALAGAVAEAATRGRER
jgi:lysophospholipase L1-like esterase